MQRASLLAGLQSFVDRIHRRGAARSAGLADFLDTAESYIEPSLRYDPKNDDVTRVYETTGLFVPGTGETVSVVVRVGLGPRPRRRRASRDHAVRPRRACLPAIRRRRAAVDEGGGVSGVGRGVVV